MGLWFLADQLLLCGADDNSLFLLQDKKFAQDPLELFLRVENTKQNGDSLILVRVAAPALSFYDIVINTSIFFFTIIIIVGA